MSFRFWVSSLKTVLEIKRRWFPYKVYLHHTVRYSSQGLRRRTRVQPGVCGVSVQLRTPKKRKENVQWKRKSAIEEKNIEVYSRERSFSPTSVVIKTNPLFRSSVTPQRQLPENFKVCDMNVLVSQHPWKREDEHIKWTVIFQFSIEWATVECSPTEIHCQDKGGRNGQCHHSTGQVRWVNSCLDVVEPHIS